MRQRLPSLRIAASNTMGDRMPNEETKKKLTTVGDMIDILQDEIDDLKEDRLTVEKARTVAKYRQLQLKTAEICIGYARMLRGKEVGGPQLPLLGFQGDPKKIEAPRETECKARRKGLKVAVSH